jgi:CIC family chloride channel protein
VNEPSLDEADAPSPRLAWLFMVGLGGLIGLLVGGLAAAFRLVVDALVTQREALFTALAPVSVLGWLGPILVVGLSLLAAAELVRRFAPEAGGSGIQEIEGALEDERRLRWQRVLPVKFLGAALALGSGAILGREGPTVHMGGALGAMVSERFRLTAQNRHILVAAGAAAGLAAAFNAPIAGILFVFEEMRRRFEFHFTSIETVLVAAALADLTVRLVTGQGPVIQMLDFPESPLGALWVFPLFGALFGGFGVAFNGLLLGTLNGIDRLPAVAHRLAPFVIGAGLGALGYWLPDAVGGGYGVIGDALAGRIAGGVLLSFFAIRFVATLLSYGSGAPGGIFAPMLALGTLFGMWFGAHAHDLAPQLVPHAGVFAVAGMAAFFAATVRAPMTGVALAVEMTGNFDQILPLIFTCVGAGLAAQALGGRPIYASLLERTLRVNRNE